MKKKTEMTALCLPDPYGMHWDWEVIRMAGQLRSIDLFLNFPIMAVNRNILHSKPTKREVKSFSSFWGGGPDTLYHDTGQADLFGEKDSRKLDNEHVMQVFRSRLKKIAGFKHVSDPLAMRNEKGSTIYYLLFASHKPVATHIVNAIFKKYRNKGT